MWPHENAVYAQSSTLVTFPDIDFLVHLIMTEDLKLLFGKGRLHTDDHPFLEFSAPPDPLSWPLGYRAHDRRSALVVRCDTALSGAPQ